MLKFVFYCILYTSNWFWRYVLLFGIVLCLKVWETRSLNLYIYIFVPLILRIFLKKRTIEY